MTRPPEPAVKSAPRPKKVGQSALSQSFAQIVALLMRDPGFRNLRLSDLEWLLLPPLMTLQCRLAHSSAQKDGFYIPVAVALWARVSPVVDKRLSENLDAPLQLRPSEWTSGDILWLIALAGDQRVLPQFLEQLKQGDFKGKSVKLRARSKDNKVVVKTLG